ncbi:hypothetical protein BGW80DRAFT_1446520 [Lactifluus volemus]|nr:hypothetical protein BGW80DRAFT_1446520 [Lactifluus volemus]
MTFTTLPALTSTQSIGPTPTMEVLHLMIYRTLITRISNIAVWDNGANIVGIQITYIVNGQAVLTLHGSNTGNVNNVNLINNDVLVGVYGGRLNSGAIQNMSFVVFNTQTGSVNVQGPFGGGAVPQGTFGTFGTIAAFLGTVTSAGVLESIGFWKSDI